MIVVKTTVTSYDRFKFNYTDCIPIICVTEYGVLLSCLVTDMMPLKFQSGTASLKFICFDFRTINEGGTDNFELRCCRSKGKTYPRVQ